MNTDDIKEISNSMAEFIKNGELLKKEGFQKIDEAIKSGCITELEGNLIKLNVSTQLSFQPKTIKMRVKSKDFYFYTKTLRHFFNTGFQCFMIVWLIMFLLGQISVTVNSSQGYYSVQVEKNR